MPWSGSCQRRSTASTIASTTRQSASRTEPARVGDGGEQVGDRAEDVELDLPVGRVADAHRPGAGVAGQRVDDRLRAELEPVDGVERVQPLRVAAGALDAAVDPAQERLGLVAASRGRPAPARSSRRRAASSSGSPSCGRRRAPRAATSSPRRGSSPVGWWHRPRSVSALRSTWSRAVRGQPQARRPVAPRLLGRAPAARRSAPGAGSRLVRSRSGARARPCRRRRRGRRRRGRCRGRRRRRRPTRRPGA